MKKRLLVPIVAVMLGTILLSGCTPGVATEDFTAAQNRIEELEVQVASLSAISAYNVWYDQYYAVGAYVFADVAAFNDKLGAMVVATGDSASTTAWNTYLAADTALNSVVEALPEDYTTWNEEQNNRWLEATTARTNALGEVGTALFGAIVE